MTINYTITTIKRELIRAFATVDEWFDRDDDFLEFKPREGKSVREIFAHIIHLSDSLMGVIDHGGDQARRQAIADKQRGVTRSYAVKEVLFEEENIRNFFYEITGKYKGNTLNRSLPEIRSELRDQLDRCLCHLELLRNGEGVLHNTSLNVQGHDTIDVYQCIRLLSLNLWKYIAILIETDKEFNERT